MNGGPTSSWPAPGSVPWPPRSRLRKAVAPLDALTQELFDCADKRLLSRKRVGRQP